MEATQLRVPQYREYGTMRFFLTAEQEVELRPDSTRAQVHLLLERQASFASLFPMELSRRFRDEITDAVVERRAAIFGNRYVEADVVVGVDPAVDGQDRTVVFTKESK